MALTLDDHLVNASGALALFLYVMIGALQIRLRWAGAVNGRRPALAMWLFPWLSDDVRQSQPAFEEDS